MKQTKLNFQNEAGVSASNTKKEQSKKRDWKIGKW